MEAIALFLAAIASVFGFEKSLDYWKSFPNNVSATKNNFWLLMTLLLLFAIPFLCLVGCVLVALL